MRVQLPSAQELKRRAPRGPIGEAAADVTQRPGPAALLPARAWPRRVTSAARARLAGDVTAPRRRPVSASPACAERPAVTPPGAPAPPLPPSPPAPPGMAPRLQLEKAAWRWAETVPPEEVAQEHIEAAYRVGLQPCQRGACR